MTMVAAPDAVGSDRAVGDPLDAPFDIRFDVVFYAGSAVVAAGVVLVSGHRIHQTVGAYALVAYVVGAALAVAVASSRSRLEPGRLLLVRVLLAVAVFLGAAVVPQAGLVAERAEDPTGHHAHAETAVIEEGARAVVRGENPYDSEFDGDGIAYWSARIRTHFPYLPAMALLGVPRVASDDSPLADGRIVFLAVALGTFAAGAALWRTGGTRRLAAFQWLFVAPSGALLVAGGGHDLPVLALLFLGLVLLGRRWFLLAGLALGLAASMRHNAWLLLPFAVLVAPVLRARVRMAAAMLGVIVMWTLPFVLWSPGSFLEDAVRWPLGLGRQATNAEAPTLGSVVVDVFPQGRAAVVAVLLGAVVVGAVAVTRRRPPRSPADAARYAGWTLLALMLAAPAGRIGYLVYPVALLGWAWVLREPASTGAPGGVDRRRAPASAHAAGRTEWYASGDSNPEPMD